MRETLPDALDLLVVCVEAGMGIDAAFNRVGREQNAQNLALGEEILLATQEMQAGAARKEALIRLADRVGLDELKPLSRFSPKPRSLAEASLGRCGFTLIQCGTRGASARKRRLVRASSS